MVVYHLRIHNAVSKKTPPRASLGSPQQHRSNRLGVRKGRVSKVPTKGGLDGAPLWTGWRRAGKGNPRRPHSTRVRDCPRWQTNRPQTKGTGLPGIHTEATPAQDRAKQGFYAKICPVHVECQDCLSFLNTLKRTPTTKELLSDKKPNTFSVCFTSTKLQSKDEDLMHIRGERPEAICYSKAHAFWQPSPFFFSKLHINLTSRS